MELIASANRSLVVPASCTRQRGWHHQTTMAEGLAPQYYPILGCTWSQHSLAYGLDRDYTASSGKIGGVSHLQLICKYYLWV